MLEKERQVSYIGDMNGRTAEVVGRSGLCRWSDENGEHLVDYMQKEGVVLCHQHLSAINTVIHRQNETVRGVSRRVSLLYTSERKVIRMCWMLQ